MNLAINILRTSSTSMVSVCFNPSVLIIGLITITANVFHWGIEYLLD